METCYADSYVSELNWISNWLNFKNPEFGDSSLQTDLFNPEAICNKGLGFKVNLIFIKKVICNEKKIVFSKPLRLSKSNKFWNQTINFIPGGAQTFSKMPFQHGDGVAPKFIKKSKRLFFMGY